MSVSSLITLKQFNYILLFLAVNSISFYADGGNTKLIKKIISKSFKY